MKTPPLHSRQSLLQWTRRALRELGVRPSKKLSQSFIINPRLVYAIIENTLSTDTLEIGPGLGTITYHLASRTRRLLAVEIDKRLAQHLASLRMPGVTIVNADALYMEWTTPQLVSNTPFQASSDIVVKMCRSNNVVYAVLVLQREVAERLISPAGTGSYGRLSVLVQLLFDTEIKSVFGPSSYYPSPDVETAVMVFRRRDMYRDIHRVVEEVTRKAFMQRRRRIVKVLKKTGFDEQCIRQCITADKRVYEATPEEYLCIAEKCAETMRRSTRYS